MNRTRHSKIWDSGSIFRRVFASLTVLLFLVSTNLSTAALAEGVRQAALEQFKMDNPGMAHKELHQMFKQEWNAQKNSNDVRGFVSPLHSSAAVGDSRQNNNHHIDRSDFASRAEFQAAKHAFKFQQQNFDDVKNHTVQQIGSKFLNVSSGLALDLGSAIETITLGDKLFNQQESFVINVGGQNKTLGAGSKVTAAEYVAAKQVMGGGSQSVILDAQGRAVGGEVDLSAMTNGNASLKVSSLNVPVAVTASGEFGKGGDVKLSGDLSNSGIINAFTSKEGQVSAVIKADNITNTASGAINSTVADLTLLADKSLVNDGTISATGSLTVSAGASITNSGIISSAGNLNLQSPNVTNSGSLVSTQSSINLSTPIAQEMNVNNSGGTISALNGSINIRDAAYSAAFDSNVTGGDLLSKELNAYTGAGTTNVHVNQLTGVLNTNGSAAHVSADTGTLVLGNQCLVDDPTYFNTGNIVIGGNILVGEKLVIIAGGDITTNQTSLSIVARDASNNGQDIVIVAGADVSGGGSQTPATLPSQPPVSGNATSASFTGASASGGIIDFSTVSSGSIIDASANASDRNGGNILLAAFHGNSNNNGQILLGNNWELKAGGQGTGSNGNISVIAGAASGNGISLGQVRNDGGTGPSAVSIVNAQPVLSSGTSIAFDSFGAITTGNTLIGASATGGGTVSVGPIITNGDITVRSGADTVVGNISGLNGSYVQVHSGGDLSINDISVGVALSPARTLLTAENDIVFQSQIRTDGGILAVAGGDLITGSGGLNSPAIFTDRNGDTGSVSLVAGAAFQVNANDVTITGSSLSGGSISFDLGTQIQNLRATSSNNGNGGDLNLIAYNGEIHLPGDAVTAFSVSTAANGGAGFSNGNIVIVAGSDTTSAIVMGGAVARGTPDNNTGSIFISASDPGAAGAVVLSTGANFAKVVSGNFTSGSISTSSGVEIKRELVSAGSSVTINGGAAGVKFNDITSFNNFQVTSLGDITSIGGNALITGAGEGQNTLLWTALGNITFSKRINLHASGGGSPITGGGGGVALIAGGTIQTVTNTTGFGFSDASIETHSGYDGGNIAVVAGADFTRSGNTVTINGQSGSGGSILFDGSATGGFTGLAITHVDAHSQGGDPGLKLDGGDITLIAYNDILLGPTATTFLSAAAGSYHDPGPPADYFGVNGNVTIVAPGNMTLPKIDMAQNQGGSVVVRAATPSLASIDVAPASAGFGTISGGNFANGALTGSSLNFSADDFSGSSYSIATNGNIAVANITLATLLAGNQVGSVNLQAGGTITVGNIDVHSDVDGVAAGNVYLQSGSDIVVGNINASHGITNGDAGSVTLLSNSATQFESGTGSAGANRSGTINLGVALAGNGGTLNITNSGSGGIKLTSAPNMAINEGDGANLTLDAGTGSLDVTPLGSTISVDAATQTTVSHNGGSLTLRFGTISPNIAYVLNANSTGANGQGGHISIDKTVGNLLFGNGLGQFMASASGVGFGTIDAVAAGNLFVTFGTTLIADDFNFDASGLVTISSDMSGSNLTANAGVQISIAANLNFAGSVDLTSQVISANDVTVTANDITIAGPNLFMSTSNEGVVFNGAVSTRITSTTGDLTLSSGAGTFTYNGGVILSAAGAGQSIQAAGSNSVTDTQSFLVTSNLVGGTIGANFTPGGLWTLTNSGTYANNPGPVVLSGALNFGGSNFAIISTGDIDLSGATINLSGATGGNLTLLAGYNFDFETGGGTTGGVLRFSTGVMSNIVANGTGGSILGGADIDVSGTAGNAGKVIAAANLGTITLGDIIATGTGGNGGNVTLIATNGIDLSAGTIDTAGTLNGTVAISVGNASIGIGASITNGTLSVGGVSLPSTGTAGDIVLGNLNVGNLSIRGALTAGDSISQANGATLTANQINSLFAGAGTVNISNVTTPLIGVFGNSGQDTGTVTLNSLGSVSYVLSGSHNFTGIASGQIASVSGTTGTLSLTGSAGPGLNAMNANAGVTATGSITLTGLGGGAIAGQYDTGVSITINSSGTIGPDSGSPLITNAPVMSLTSAGSTYVSNTNSSGTNLIELSTGTSVFLVSQNTITSDVVVQADDAFITVLNGNIGASGNAVSFNTDAQVQLVAKGGSIFATGSFGATSAALVAGENIELSGATFNLNGTTPGDLTLIAGYDFSVNVGPTVVLDSFTASTNGGSIFGAPSISVQGVPGPGGNVLAVAHAGSANNGSISLGNVNTQGTTTGGNVLVIGEGGVSVGDVISANTAGDTSSGTIGLFSATPSVPTGAAYQIQNGVATGVVSAGGFTNHAVVANSLNAGRSSVDLFAGSGTGGAITVSTALSARQISIQGNSISFGFSNLTANTEANQAGFISLSANTVIGSGSTLVLDTNGATSGFGGEIDLNLFANASKFLGDTGDFQFIANATGGAGVGGKVVIASNGDLQLFNNAINVAGSSSSGEVSISSAFLLNVNAGTILANSGNGDGAKITLNAGLSGTGFLSVDSSLFDQTNAGVGTNGDGGLLSLSGPSIVVPGLGSTSAAPIVLTAMGDGTGDGGNIEYRTSDPSATFIGAPAKAPKGIVHFIEAYATGGGNAGEIEIETGGSLTINNVNLLDASTNGSAGGALDGASYTLKAGETTTGALIINGSLNANGLGGGDAGKISLRSRSTTAFSVNPVKLPKNGIFGTLTASGANGRVEIENLAGGILVGSNIAFNARDVELTAGGTKGAITAGSFVISALDSLVLQAASGAIGGKRPLFVNAPLLSASTNGIVGITNVFAGPSILEDSFGGTGFTLKTGQTVTLNDITTNVGSILVSTTAGLLKVDDGVSLTANNGALTLQVVGTGVNDRIEIGANAQVQTLGAGKTVSLIIGPTIPKTGTNPLNGGNTPVGMNASITPGNFIFLGPGNGIAINPGDTADVTAKNQNVIFNNLSIAGEKITLGDGSLVMADPPSPAAQSFNFAGLSANQTMVAAAAPVTIPASFEAKSSALFGFAGENSMQTADLTIVSLNAPQQLQTASNSILMTAGSSSLGQASLASIANGQQSVAVSCGATQSSEDDNSYAVGFCPVSGETDSAICSDSLVLAVGEATAQGVQTIQHSDRVVIKKGNVLFVPFKATTVETPNGIVHIDAKSVALVSSTDAGLAVYDLEDQHKGSVSVESNGHNVVLSPGRHVMVTKHHTAEFAQINAVETIAHRNVQSTVKNGHRAHTSEFSVLTAMDTVKPLKALAMSKHANAKQIADRMLKTTAIILQIGGASGQYQHYFKPRMTAMQK